MALAILGIRLAGLHSQMQPLPVEVDCASIMLRAITEGIKSQNIRLTDMAWDSIESAGDDTREFLYRLSQLKCEHLEMHQTYVAIYENPVVRDLVMESWRNELVRPRGIPPEIVDLVSSWGERGS